MRKRRLFMLVLSLIFVFAASCGGNSGSNGGNSDNSPASDNGSSISTIIEYRLGVTINNKIASFGEYSFNGKEYALSYGTIATIAANKINETTANPLEIVVAPFEDVASIVLSNVLTVNSGADFNEIDDSCVAINKDIVTKSEVDGYNLKLTLDTSSLENCKMVVVVVHVYFGDFDDFELYIGVSR